jgi:CRP/FNR family transcriptional regulator, anaerobic regulatory protein
MLRAPLTDFKLKTVPEKLMSTVSILSRVSPVPVTRQSADVPAAPTALKTLCSTCHLRDLCLPCGMTEPDVNRLDSLMFARRRILAGQTLYRDGDRFQFIYAVRAGTLKSGLILADGREQVSGFHIAGELVGLDGVAQGRHASTAIALEDTEICAIPYAHLTDLATGATGVHHVISRLMSREILREGSLMMLLGSMSADERLAAFLLNLSQRFGARGYSEREFHLRMSRAEIGSYLGMKLETVSRTFTALQQEGLLEVDKRHIRILDLEGLKRRFDMRVH